MGQIGGLIALVCAGVDGIENDRMAIEKGPFRIGKQAGIDPMRHLLSISALRQLIIEANPSQTLAGCIAAQHHGPGARPICGATSRAMLDLPLPDRPPTQIRRTGFGVR